MESLRPYALLAPHLGGTGHGNTRRGRQSPRPRAVGRAGAVRPGARGGRTASARRVRPGQRRLRRQQRRLAGLRAQRRDDLGSTTAPDRATSRSMGELPRRAVLALGFGSSAEAAATLARSRACSSRSSALGAADRRLGRSGTARCAEQRRLAPTCRRRSADQVALSTMVLRVAPGQDLPRRDGGQPQRPWGNTARRARRLSPGVAARPRRDAPARCWRSAPSARRATPCAT